MGQAAFGPPFSILNSAEENCIPHKNRIESKLMGMLQAGIIPVTTFEQNCTVLFDIETNEGVVVDPGGDVDVILQILQENNVQIHAIWLTHGHLDHAGGATQLKEALGVEIIGPHRDDQQLLDNIEAQAKMFGVDDDLRNCVPDRWLENGDTVSFGDHIFEVYHTPGHAAGHVIFFHREQKFAHLGDVLFHGSVGEDRFARRQSCDSDELDQDQSPASW